MLPSVQQRHRPPQSMPISGIDCFSDRVIQQWFIGRACSAVLMLLQFVVFLVAMSCPVVLLPCFAMRTRAPRLGLRSYRDRIPLPYQRCGGNCPRPEAQGRVHQARGHCDTDHYLLAIGGPTSRQLRYAPCSPTDSPARKHVTCRYVPITVIRIRNITVVFWPIEGRGWQACVLESFFLLPYT